MPKELVLILGGARSGKSAFAEHLASQAERVLFVATAQALDASMQVRIAAHRERRPLEWSTVEEPLDLARVVPSALEGHDTCLVDCLTLWVSNLLLAKESHPKAEAEILEQVHGLLEAYEESSATWIVVSNEVGLGVVPPTELGSKYRDVLGRVNQAVASRADKVYLMVAGLALEMKSLGALPHDCIGLHVESRGEG